MNLMLAFIVFLVLLRLFERAMEKSVTPFDPSERIDHRLHLDRQPRETVGKVTYDPIADATLRKLQERRRKAHVDNGQRRRRTDGSRSV